MPVRTQNPPDFLDKILDHILGHLLKRQTTRLLGILIAKSKMIENTAILRIEKHDRRTFIAQRFQKIQTVTNIIAIFDKNRRRHPQFTQHDSTITISGHGNTPNTIHREKIRNQTRKEHALTETPLHKHKALINSDDANHLREKKMPAVSSFMIPIIKLTAACVLSAASHQNIPAPIMWGLLATEGGTEGKQHINTNGSYDIGPFQINDQAGWVQKLAYYQFGGNYALARETIKNNGCYNAEVSAWVMKQAINEAKGNLALAIGYYNSHTPEKMALYQANFTKRLKELYGNNPQPQVKMTPATNPSYQPPVAAYQTTVNSTLPPPAATHAPAQNGMLIQDSHFTPAPTPTPIQTTQTEPYFSPLATPE